MLSHAGSDVSDEEEEEEEKKEKKDKKEVGGGVGKRGRAMSKQREKKRRKWLEHSKRKNTTKIPTPLRYNYQRVMQANNDSTNPFAIHIWKTTQRIFQPKKIRKYKWSMAVNDRIYSTNVMDW